MVKCLVRTEKVPDQGLRPGLVALMCVFQTGFPHYATQYSAFPAAFRDGGGCSFCADY